MGNCTSLQVAPEPASQFYDEVFKTLPSMEGKVVAITGCTTGTGFTLAKTCALKGAYVLMLNRKSDRATEAVAEINKLEGIVKPAKHVTCDLARMSSVKNAVEDLHTICEHTGLDVLCNNAGIMGGAQSRSKDKHEETIQVNHLSHFFLASDCWDLLELAAEKRGESRIVHHSSMARNNPASPLKMKFFEKDKEDKSRKVNSDAAKWGGDGMKAPWVRYQQSKLANLLTTYAIDEHIRLNKSKVLSLCAHPGVSRTNLQKTMIASRKMSLVDTYVLNSINKFYQHTDDGALGIIKCCCEAGVKSGEFYGPDPKLRVGKPVLLAEERNKKSQDALWEISKDVTGVDAFGKQDIWH